MPATERKDYQRFVWLALLAIAVGISTAPLAAQEITGAQAAAAMEKTLVEAIAKCEGSVVAIARVAKNDNANPAAIDPRFDPFGRLQVAGGSPPPGDPDFIPNDFGTGVVVDPAGLILTHFQILGDGAADKWDYFVTATDRKIYQATVKAADPRGELAVLEIKASGLKPIKFGDAAGLKKGHIVIALGNPYGIARDGQASASWGIISNLARKAGAGAKTETAPNGKSTLHHTGTLIQTDAKLNLGASGGALVNLKGEMVGLTTSLAAQRGYEQAAGYAIPVDEAFKEAVERLKQGREVEYGMLGIAPENLAQRETADGNHVVLSPRVYISKVLSGTPAQRFGLQPRDQVTEVDGEPVFDSDGLVLRVSRRAPGNVVNLRVQRDGRPLVVPVELAKYLVADNKVITTPPPKWRGIRVDYATVARDLRNRADRGEVDPAGCVVIAEVDKDSPAWKEGLRPEMFISMVGATRVSRPKDFQNAVARQSGPVQLRLFLPDTDRPLRTIPPGDG